MALQVRTLQYQVEILLIILVMSYLALVLHYRSYADLVEPIHGQLNVHGLSNIKTVMLYGLAVVTKYNSAGAGGIGKKGNCTA